MVKDELSVKEPWRSLMTSSGGVALCGAVPPAANFTIYISHQWARLLRLQATNRCRCCLRPTPNSPYVY